MPAFTSDFVSAAIEIARAAGDLLMSHFRGGNFAKTADGTDPAPIKIEYKGEVDLVTVADREAEALITGELRRRWPEHNILGEEGTRKETGSAYRWYVDPLDGTTNFAHGYPVFCVSLGLEKDGELIAGVICDPTRCEIFAAEQGSGTFLNARRVSVSPTQKLGESILGTGFPSHKRHKNPNIHFYHQLTLRSHGVRRAGSAALDLANVACGRYDGFWEFNLNPWDTAAGVLLVREAGGVVTGFRGGAFDIGSREVLASNGRIHAELIREFGEIFAGRGLEPLPDPREYAAAQKKE
jgi:myo-inositol-1(or 4)-monophosphatase